MKQKLALFFIPLLAKIPFLSLGYGSEEDAWGHVLNILEMKESGHYIMSRLPGHPVYEALLYILWPIHSPLVYNLISAVASSFAVLAFYQLCNYFKITKSFWVTLAFAFIPTFFMSGTYTIDYALGLSFVLWSYWFLLKNKLFYSALLLGLAVGTRITWLLMLIPWWIQLNGFLTYHYKLKDSFRFLFVFSLVTAMAYYPVYNQYGVAFFNTYTLPYPPLPKVLYKGTIGVWGLLGCFTLFAIFAFLILQFKRILHKIKRHQFIWLIPIILYTLLFTRLPEKSAFFIPVIPFLLLFIFSLLKDKWIKPSALLFIISLLIFGINISDPLRGSTPRSNDLIKNIANQEIFFSFERGIYFLEKEKRRNKERTVKQIQKRLKEVDAKSVVICGWWFAMIEITSIENNWNYPKNIKLHYYLSDEEIMQYQKIGYELLYLPEQETINNRKNNSTLTTDIGKPINI